MSQQRAMGIRGDRARRPRQVFVVAQAYDRPGHRAVASDNVIVGESH